jgi:head-tail adaptor
VGVEVRTRTQDATGQEFESWAHAFYRWMAKRDTRAGERYTSDQLVSEVDTVFAGRFDDCEAVHPDTHRLVYRGRVYEILGRTELGRRDAMEFACKARGEESYGD